MNASRSTFTRRGCVLTALAVAALLAGFSGTAWAQSPINIGLAMNSSSRMLKEGASTDPSTDPPVTVTITRSGADTYDNDDDRSTPPIPIFVDDGGHLTLRATCNGDGFTGASATTECSFNVVVKGDTTTTPLADLGGAGSTLNFEDGPDTGDEVDKTIELLISDLVDNDDWNDETVVLTLDLQQEYPGSETSGRKLAARARTLTLTINDDEQQPTFKFDRPGIQLAKGNTQTVKAEVGLGAGGREPLPITDTSIRSKLAALTDDRDDVILTVSPSDAVGTLIEFVDSTSGMKTDLTSAGQGMYNIGKIGDDGTTDGAVGAVTATEDDGIELHVKAIDVAGFRDQQITFTLTEGRTPAQMEGDGGGIAPSDPATVTILSAEETPTVTFSKASVSIGEGDSETVHLLADTDQGSEVGSATVSMSGDALISLRQNGSAISGGTVSFGGSANAELTIVSLSDPDLEDGDEKTATITITDASDANIGDPRAVTVTVVGSTAVPVLPLVGQLLLALLLTVGGARLYRRRQG